MPDYIYLLKNRLSIHQQNALRHIREAAREAGMTVFLVGGAVRDLTSGSPVLDLDVTVQGNALKLKKPLEKSGGKLWGEHEPSRTLFFRFPVGVTVEISSARREEYPKPGKPVYHWDTILDDLRRRDFTANAMALSLNEHSYGLLMDPLNGVADIEARQLRLVSNYGFIEEPSRLLRATRLVSRLGWELDERTRTRFQNAKEENAIEALSAYHRGYELEEIGHEEDGLRALAAMEAEGWMHHLFPAWTTAAADATALEEMRRLATQLQMQGVSPDISAASIQFLTAKLAHKDLLSLKHLFVRPGFVEEWNNLDNAAKELNKQLSGKETATPSATWKLFTSADPQAVLWLGLTSKSPAIQAKYKNFFTVWPEARLKVPHALFQELRITPEIAGYEEMISHLFLGVIDGKLETDEQLRAFLEPYSPPAPPPPVTVRRTRGSKKAGEAKNKVAAEAAFDDEPLELDDEEPADAVEEDDGDSQVSLPPPPPAAKKIVVAAKKTLPASEASEGGAKAPGTSKPGASAAKTGHSAAPPPVKTAQTAVPHLVTSGKMTKVHVMAKPVKPPPPPPAPASAPSRSHGPSHGGSHGPSHGPTPAGKKSVPIKTAAVKAGAAKSAPAKTTPAKTAPARTVAAKTARGAHVKPAPHGKTPAKKAATKLAAKSHKKSEPVKKSVPAKKFVPARKHR
jgi:tRNA nucleotidyltransferase (CCA-adding enzyme)